MGKNGKNHMNCYSKAFLQNNFSKMIFLQFHLYYVVLESCKKSKIMHMWKKIMAHHCFMAVSLVTPNEHQSYKALK